MPAPDARLQYGLFAGIALAVALGVAWQWSGAAAYWIEDAYIHLAMARTLAQHGVYGVTPHEFTSSSSSPLWVAMLAAAMAPFGADVRMALALNLLAVLALAAVVARVLARTNVWFATAAAALVVLLIAPVPLVLSGMEHLGHAAAMVLAVWWLARRLSDDGPPVNEAALLALLLVLPLWRYESLWLHGLGILLALARRERRFAFLIAGAGALPVLAFGAFNQSHGWPFLPASILAKTVYLAGDGGLLWLAKYFLWWPLKRLALYVPELLVLMVVADAWLAWTIFRNSPSWRQARWIAVLLFLLGSWAHATVAAFGWGGRYEAYLLAVGLVSLGAALSTTDWRALLASRIRAIAVGVLAVALATTGALRAWTQHGDLAGRAETVALRDVWPAETLRDVCGPPPCRWNVMAMNIGALSWYASPRLTDLLALADRGVLELLRARQLDSAAVRHLAEARQIEVALIFDDFYESWIGGGVPLVKVATLTQQTNWPTPLSFYARDETAARRVAGVLKKAALPEKLQLAFEPAFR